MTDTDTKTQPETAPAPPTEQAASPSAAPAEVATREPHLTRGGTHVLMVNEITHGLWDCPVDYADIALADGWVFAEDPNTDAPGTDVAEALAELAFESAPETDTGQTGFDPAEHSVDEVNAHILKYLDQTPGEAARVIVLERAGKDRATVKTPFVPGTAGI